MAIKDKKMAQILQAATLEFLQKGLDASSMHNIAELAEVSKRTLYKYFPTKDKLYGALVDELLDRVYDHKPSYSPEKSIKNQLESIVNDKIDLYMSESFINMSKIVLGEMLKSRQPSDEQRERMFNAEVLFIEWIDAAKADEKINFEVSSDVIASQFHSILKGQTFYPVIFYFTDIEMINKKDVCDMTVNFFLNSFCSNGEQ